MASTNFRLGSSGKKNYPPIIDSVPLIADDDNEDYEDTESESKATINMGNIKLFIALFIIFMIVVSDCFTDGIIANFGDSAVHGRDLTTWGVSLQGIFLVIFYILTIYLSENNII